MEKSQTLFQVLKVYCKVLSVVEICWKFERKSSSGSWDICAGGL